MSLPGGPVDDFLHQRIPPAVWHYTSLEGLQGILSSNAVWATDARFTNDTTEFIHAKDVAMDFLDKFRPVDKEEEWVGQQVRESVVESFASGVMSSAVTEIYLASFSAIADLKSQWDMYADQSRGVSLAFNLASVRPPREFAIAATVGPCLYTQDEKVRIVEAALRHFLNTSATLLRYSSSRQRVAGDLRTYQVIQRIGGLIPSREDFLELMREKQTEVLALAKKFTDFDLLRIAAHCKHEGFREEKEWRLALSRLVNKPLGVIQLKYRGPKNVPYVASNLFQDSGRLPITRVMLGPLCNAEKVISEILKATGYDIPIEKSSIPLRR